MAAACLRVCGVPEDRIMPTTATAEDLVSSFVGERVS
jgi:hypothetical protein